MPIDPTKSKRLVIVVPNELAAQVEGLAKQSRRSTSEYVRLLLADHVAANAKPEEPDDDQ